MFRPGTVKNKLDAIFFLDECAKYFETRDTKGEDRAYWSNVYNAENCRHIIGLLNEDTIP